MKKKNFKDSAFNYRSLSRLSAVQLLYKKNFDDISLTEILDEFMQFNFDIPIEYEISDIDLVFFEKLVCSFYERSEHIDKIISECLQNNSIIRLELVLASIIRLAACELLFFSEIPAKVIINEYVNLSHAFFDDQQPNLANGVLDGLAKKIREDEFS